MKKIWPFSFYLLYYGALSSLMPFMVLFYQALKFSGSQIGLLTGVPPLITLFAAPFWTNLADSTHRHRLIMTLGIGIALACTLIMQSMTAFLVIFFLIIVINIFASPVVSLVDSATMTMLGKESSLYGRVRLGGTIGWGLAAPIVGMLVDNYGLKLAFLCYGILMFSDLVVAQKVVHDSGEHAGTTQHGFRFFLASRRWILFLSLAFLGGLGALSVSSFLFPYMAELGSSKTFMGIAAMLSTVTEVPIFFFGNYFVKRLRSYRLFIVALVLMGIRSLFFAWANTPIAALVVHVFGGMLFPAMWLAGVAYADEHAPQGLKSTAQGLFGAMSFGVGSAVGGFVGGLLLGTIGGRGLFFIFGAILLSGLVIIGILNRIIPEDKMLSAAT
jgi:PPP family 3-phenylpropionic acid transporter